VLLFGLRPKNGHDLVRDLDPSLARPAWQLFRTQLGQDFLERQIDQRMVTIGGLGKDAGRCGFSNIAEADFHAA
jgi:hypothetical protein